MTARFVIVALLAILFGGCYGAFQVAPDNVQSAGGLTPNVEDKDAGLVALASGFDIKSYKVIAVEKFPVTDPAIKDDEDRRKAAAMSTILQNELVRRLRDTGLFTRVVNLSETEFQPGAEKTLRLQGVITRLGEGSQAARAFMGLYGAGAARAQAEMRFVDTQSGTTQLATADRRKASMGFFGGDTKDHWKESFDDMARDLGKFLVRLSNGQAPGK
ncbi:MAG: DUF4410 domain-containing protein [Candidatus Rokubacteria bacterium]|nr:DUF4410 domain-containing protein [Candidatus Rokubacteria bacterium]